MLTRPSLRRARRGLGLLDTMLAVFALSAVAAWSAQATRAWTARALLAGEARALSELAVAGRRWLERDFTRAPSGSRPARVAFRDLESAGLRPPERPRNTPGRRAMSLWLWNQAPDRVMVIARARGDRALSRIPAAGTVGTGVGAILNRAGETLLRGPGVAFDMAPLNAARARFARRGDLFALEHVHTDPAASPYLHRVAVAGHPELNVMATDLLLGDSAVLSAARIETDTARVGTIEGDTEVTGELTVGGALRANGLLGADGDPIASLSVAGPLRASSLEIAGNAVLGGQLSAIGGLSGTGVTLTGPLAGNAALLGSLETGSLDTDSLATDSLAASSATFDSVTVGTLRTGGCTGCR